MLNFRFIINPYFLSETNSLFFTVNHVNQEFLFPIHILKQSDGRAVFEMSCQKSFPVDVDWYRINRRIAVKNFRIILIHSNETFERWPFFIYYFYSHVPEFTIILYIYICTYITACIFCEHRFNVYTLHNYFLNFYYKSTCLKTDKLHVSLVGLLCI